jgi:hypothetical protein
VLHTNTVRCETQHVCTTLFVLHMVCHTAAYARKEPNMKGAKTFLSELFNRFFKAIDFQVRVAMDTLATCWPGTQAQGEHCMDVPIDKGIVDVELLMKNRFMPLAGKVKLRRLLRDEYGNTPTALPLAAFCIALCKGGDALAWLARQVLVLLAMAMDTLLEEMDLPTNFVDSGGKVLAGRRPDADTKDQLLVEYGSDSKQTIEKLGRCHGLKLHWVQHAQQRMLAKYLMAARRQAYDSPRICIAMDASRMGGTDCLCGVMLCRSPADGQVRAAICPPQAFRESRESPKPKTPGNSRKLPEPPGTSRNLPESPGTSRNLPEPPGTVLPETPGKFWFWFFFGVGIP